MNALSSLSLPSLPLFSQVVVGGGLGIVQIIILLVVLGLVVGLIDRVPAIDATFRGIIKIVCIVAAILLLLHAVGIF